MVVVEALKKAGAPDRDKVRDAIENLQGFVGTAGVFNFSPADHTGLDLDAFAMLTVKGGKFTLYRK
jgi:branched-chain amino acid transport system substrate-binding protein